MAARTGMAYIIEEVRQLIDDDEVNAYLFSDEQIQRVLDQVQQEWRYLELVPLDEVQPGTGTIIWKTFVAPNNMGWWEEDDGTGTRLSLQRSGNWEVLPDETITVTYDYRLGRFMLSDHLYEVIYLTGFRYPVYNAAVLLLKRKLAKIHEHFDVMSPRTGTQQRSQIQGNIRQLIQDYLQECEPERVEVVRGDAV